MEIFPVINMVKLDGEDRGKTMEVIRDACENWGFFEVITKLKLCIFMFFRFLSVFSFLSLLICMFF